jgi:ATP-dependent DNA helicase DinG
MLDELTELIQAAGGRTLGLFSSMRAAQLAAEELRSRIPEFPILLQGEETLGELIKNFAADPKTCLFGTLSLWQGVDVPGASCQLVVMDKIPFPRPDDPLMSARQKAVEDAGGNGFMAVAATHAALLMAQGAGRLVRATGDRGVVAVLDQRLATARYGSYLKASLPDFWFTTDRNQVRRSLAAIDEVAKKAEEKPEAEQTGRRGEGRRGIDVSRLPRPRPGQPTDVRTWGQHRAPEPAQGSRGPVRGGVRSAAAPPRPCRGWSPRRRGSAGTRSCAGAATRGRPRA